MARTRTPTPTATTSTRAEVDREALSREAQAVVDDVTEQARRALAASLDRVLTSEVARLQKNLNDSLVNLGIETVAPELAGLAVETFGGSVLGDAFAGSLGSALPGILRSGTVSPGTLGRAAVRATQRGSLSRAQTAGR